MSTTAQQLTTIALAWPRLRDALDSHGAAPWPPAGRMTTYLRAIEQLDIPQRGARDGSGTGEAPAPLRIAVLDTMRAVEAALLRCADQIAAENRINGSDPTHPQLWPHPQRRTAPYAALWLCARAQGRFWPGRPLTTDQRQHLDRVADGATARIEQALHLARLTRWIDAECACGGPLYIEGGDGTPPAVRCDWCERSVTTQLAA